MIKIEDIQKITKLVLSTGFLKNQRPLSLMLIGEAGIGKTEIISHFSGKNVFFCTDLSKFGLLNLLKENKQLTHIVIPDFIKVTQKKRSTSDDLISVLNAFVEEGLDNFDLYNFKASFNHRRGGLVTATTKASYDQHKKSWNKIGFVSRMLVCSFAYNHDTIQQIMDFIEEDNFKPTEKQALLKLKKFDVQSSKELNKKLEKINENKFRTQKQLQTLAKANALIRGSKKVENEDIEEIFRLSKFLNLNYTKI